MKAYMTNGTLDLLTKIDHKHPAINLLIMQGDDTYVAYYEDEKEIFESPRKYEIVVSSGQLQSDGFVVMNNIPVTDEGKPIFENQFKSRAGMIDGTPGFYALRVLRPLRGNTYIVMVQWQDQSSYEKWKNSESFAKSHQKSDKDEKRPPYAAGPSYVTTYRIAEVEDGG